MIVSRISQHLGTPALLVVLVGIVGLGAASAMAALAAGSAATPFELVFYGEYESETTARCCWQDASPRRRRSASPGPPSTWISACIASRARTAVAASRSTSAPGRTHSATAIGASSRAPVNTQASAAEARFGARMDGG